VVHFWSEIWCTFRLKKALAKVVLVADSALLSQENIAELEEKNLEYIVGARLKKVKNKLKDKILDPNNYKEIAPGYQIAHFSDGNRKIVVSDSSKRALKDASDRKKAITKLKKKLAKSSSPKQHLSNSGYRKYLKV
jgi:transposase